MSLCMLHCECLECSALFITCASMFMSASIVYLEFVCSSLSTGASYAYECGSKEFKHRGYGCVNEKLSVYFWHPACLPDCVSKSC